MFSKAVTTDLIKILNVFLHYIHQVCPDNECCGARSTTVHLHICTVTIMHIISRFWSFTLYHVRWIISIILPRLWEKFRFRWYNICTFYHCERKFLFLTVIWYSLFHCGQKHVLNTLVYCVYVYFLKFYIVSWAQYTAGFFCSDNGIMNIISLSEKFISIFHCQWKLRF